MRIRRLSEAEIAVWRSVAETVTPRPGSALPSMAATPAPPPEAARPEAPTPSVARSFFAAAYTPPVSSPKPPPTGLERRYKKRVARGAIPVDAALDLHGMTQAQAHFALRRFLIEAQRDGAKLVIVVTGKGTREKLRPDSAEAGVLRRAVPFWLRDGGLRGVVLGFEEAALSHGGSGALYVRLRRPPPG